MIAPRQTDTDGCILFTIGYEGLDLGQFLKLLTHHQIRVLVDVRELPLSRKKGFSKTALSGALAAHGIEYRHLKALGSPKVMRKQLKSDWDYDAFFSAYDEYLHGQVQAVETLQGIIEADRRVCLLCFEKSHEHCHRSRIAKRVAQKFRRQLTVEPVNTWVK